MNFLYLLMSVCDVGKPFIEIYHFRWPQNAFQTHENLATASHFVTAVPICVNSSIDFEPRFHISFILTATILSIWHSTTTLFFLATVLLIVTLVFLITHPRTICINRSIDSDTRGRFVSTVLSIPRFSMFELFTKC